MRAFSKICALLAVVSAAFAQQYVRVDLQVNLFMKILRYDRNIATRGKGGIKMGVLFNPKVRSSVRIKDKFIEEFELLENKSIKGIPVFVVPVAGVAKLEESIASYGINVLYICPGFDKELDGILSVCRENSVLTLTGVQEYAEGGVAVGLGIKEGRPEIIVNLPVAKEVGANFGADLLKLARVIK